MLLYYYPTVYKREIHILNYDEPTGLCTISQVFVFVVSNEMLVVSTIWFWCMCSTANTLTNRIYKFCIKYCCVRQNKFIYRLTLVSFRSRSITSGQINITENNNNKKKHINCVLSSILCLFVYFANFQNRKYCQKQKKIMTKAILVLLLALFVFGESIKLEQKYLWKEVEYAWPSEEARKQALESGNYIPENNLLLGLDVWRDKLFITVPR